MNIVRQYVAYLRDNPKGYWFKRKVFGWGWIPATWQGWLATAIFVFLLIYSTRRIEVVLVFILVCFLKGEKLRWQWGFPKQKASDATRTFIRSLSIFYILFISIFALDVFETYRGLDLLVALFMHLLPSIVFALILIVSWKREDLGGILFFASGVGTMFFFNTYQHTASFLLVSLPPIIIGIFYLYSYLKAKRPQ